MSLWAAPHQALAFELGSSGIHVTRTPQSLLLRWIVPHSPAARAGLRMKSGVVARIRYLNGTEAMALAAEHALEAAYASDSLTVTLGVRTPEALEERLEGPYRIQLAESPDAMLLRLISGRQWQAAANLARSQRVSAEAASAAWARLALEAEEQARADRWHQALALAGVIPAAEPAYQVVAARLPYWRTAAERTAREDRRLLGHEIAHPEPYPRRHKGQP